MFLVSNFLLQLSCQNNSCRLDFYHLFLGYAFYISSTEFSNKQIASDLLISQIMQQ